MAGDPAPEPVLVDARGLRCPWPVLRLAKAMRGPPPAAAVRLLADDPAAAREVEALAQARGWTVTGRRDDGFLIRAGVEAPCA